MTKNIKKFIILLSIIIGISVFLPCVFAQPLDNSDLLARMTLSPDLKPDNSPGVIIGEETLKGAGAEAAFANYTLQMLAGGLISIAAPVAIIIIAIAGLIAVVSHGDQKLIDKAKKTLTWAIIGLLLIIFSWIIVRATISVVIEANPPRPGSTQQDTTPPKAPAGETEEGTGGTG